MENKDRPKLNQEQIERLCENLKDEVTLDFIKDIFAFTDDSNHQDIPHNAELVLTKELNDKYFGFIMDKDIVTTPGRLVLNVAMYKKEIRSVLPYLNERATKKSIGKITSLASKYLLEDKITRIQYGQFITDIFWIAYSIASFFGVSLDLATIRPVKEAEQMKKDYIKNNKDVFKNNDISAYNKFQNETLKKSKEVLIDRKATGLDYYESGAAGAFDNNYKNTSFGRGPLVHSDDISKTWAISTVSLVEGVPKNQLHMFADQAVIGAFARAAKRAFHRKF